MSTLLLRFEGPLQSWGSVTRGRVRQTYLHPSKSGVIGLLANALGRKFDADVSDLAALRMGLRLERRGTLLTDYSSVQNVARANNKAPKPSHEQFKMYLADASFLVGLEGSRDLLESIQAAAEQPSRLLFLGRKACLLSAPLVLPNGLVDDGLENALTGYPWFQKVEKPETVLIQIEDPTGSLVVEDVPLGAFDQRRFGSRRVKWISSTVRSITEIFSDEQNTPIFF